jgi:hypothetical protein
MSQLAPYNVCIVASAITDFDNDFHKFPLLEKCLKIIEVRSRNEFKYPFGNSRDLYNLIGSSRAQEFIDRTIN